MSALVLIGVSGQTNGHERGTLTETVREVKLGERTTCSDEDGTVQRVPDIEKHTHTQAGELSAMKRGRGRTEKSSK